MSMHNALGSARGAAGVHDVVHVCVGQVGIRGIVLGRPGGEVLIGAEAGRRLALTADQDTAVGPQRRQLAANAAEGIGEGRIGEHGDRVGIPQEARKSMVLQERAHRNDVDAGLGCGPVGLHQLETVGKDRGHLLALDDAGGEERVRHAVHRGVQLPEGQPLAARDQRQMIGPVAGVARQQSAYVHVDLLEPVLGA